MSYLDDTPESDVEQFEGVYPSFCSRRLQTHKLIHYCHKPITASALQHALFQDIAHNLLGVRQSEQDVETPAEIIRRWMKSDTINVDTGIRLAVCLYETLRVLNPGVREGELLDRAVTNLFDLLVGEWLMESTWLGLYDYATLYVIAVRHASAFDLYQLADRFMAQSARDYPTYLQPTNFNIVPVIRSMDIVKQGYDIELLDRLEALPHLINSMDVPDLYGSHPSVDHGRELFGLFYSFDHPALLTSRDQANYANLSKYRHQIQRPVALSLQRHTPDLRGKPVRVCNAFKSQIIHRINRSSPYTWAASE